MSNPQDFAIQVTSEDPNKKKKEEENKDKEEGSSTKQVNGKKADGKDGEDTEELVSLVGGFIEMLIITTI